MKIIAISPDKKEEIHISMEGNVTRLCMKSSPEKCSTHTDLTERGHRRLAEILYHEGWEVSVS